MLVESSPLLIALFLIATAFARAALRRKELRDRRVEPYWGDEIPCYKRDAEGSGFSPPT